MGQGSDGKDSKTKGDELAGSDAWELPHGKNDGVSIQVSWAAKPDVDPDELLDEELEESEPSNPPEPPVPPQRVSMQVVAEDGLQAAVESIMPQVAHDIEAINEAEKIPREEAQPEDGDDSEANPAIDFSASDAETDEFSDLCDEVEALCGERCFDKAFQILEILEQSVADQPYLSDLKSACEYRALEFYEKNLSPTDRPLLLKLSSVELTGQKLNKEIAYVLSRIDGVCTADDLADITGFSRFKTFHILYNLIDSGIVSFEP